ncbi:MAG: hypothetical protein ACTSVE_14975, partial [Candidatus Helarchaeota archaeon]
MDKEIKKSVGFIFIILLWILNSFLRIFFGCINLTVGSMLDEPVHPLILQFIIVMFLLLGVSGAVTTFGLMQLRKWGVYGAILVSMVTISFDIWGITIQFTAAMGFFVPIIVL